jgi:hypothetical protein
MTCLRSFRSTLRSPHRQPAPVDPIYGLILGDVLSRLPLASCVWAPSKTFFGGERVAMLHSCLLTYCVVGYACVVTTLINP